MFRIFMFILLVSFFVTSCATNDDEFNKIRQETLNRIYAERDPAQTPGIIKKAKRGDADAQIELAHRYYYGAGGLQRDFIQAKFWYEKAAKNGKADAYAQLSEMYKCGKGARQDFRISKELAGMACDNGSLFGCAQYKQWNQFETVDRRILLKAFSQTCY